MQICCMQQGNITVAVGMEFKFSFPFPQDFCGNSHRIPIESHRKSPQIPIGFPTKYPQIPHRIPTWRGQPPPDNSTPMIPIPTGT